MNKVITLCAVVGLWVVPVFGFAQNKPPSVVGPQYNTDFTIPNNSNFNSGIGNIPNNIVVSETREEVTGGASTTNEIVVTTEIGQVVLPLATSTEKEQDQEPERLSEVVDRINKDYEVAEQECQNGSWFQKIWCSMTSWL